MTSIGSFEKQQKPGTNLLMSSPIPPDGTVVSRYADGRVASLYGQLEWDWTPYNNGKKSILNFRYFRKNEVLTKRRREIISEMRWLLYLIATTPGGKRYASRTLQRYMIMLRKIANYCEREAVSIRDLVGDPELLWTFVSISTGGVARDLRCFLGKLARLGSDCTGYRVVDKKFIKAIKEVSDQYLASLKQHPPLPTRIYSHVLSVLFRELTDFELIATSYLNQTRDCAIHSQLGRYSRRKRAMKELLGKRGLTEYFVAKGLHQNRRGLTSGLTRIFIYARLTIQAYSGMRASEAASLRYDCLEERKEFGRKIYIIHGTTTKLNGGKPKKTRWVTNGEGARAIQILQQITRLNHDLFVRGQPTNKSDLKAVPLFASVGYFQIPGGGRRLDRKGEISAGAPCLAHATDEVRALLQPAIVEEDLRELEQIDLHRAWRSEPKFQLGVPWTLTSHQLRRSLALYAQRSGLVSLPSLRRQLQHITEDMSRYYAKGSAFAENFVHNNTRHFASEWQATQPISSGLSYVKNVIFSDDVLFGGHGNWIARRLHDGSDHVEISRDVTLKRFFKGEISYRETNLGGCTKVGPCDIRPIRWLNVDCVKGCASLVGKLKPLERVISHYTNYVSTLDPSSPAYQSEKADLDVLVNVLERVRRQSNMGRQS